MTQVEAERLVAKLFAAFPYRKSDMTAAVYVERVAKLEYDPAKETVEGLIDNASQMPVIAEVLDGYREVQKRRRLERVALEEAPLTPEQREQNLRWMRELARRYQPREMA